jgi:deoxyribonuclease IV
MAEASHTPALVYDNADEYRPEPQPEPHAPAWCDGSVRIGIHTSIAGNIAGSLEIACKLGCNALQIFSASPRMWPRGGSRISATDVALFRARRSELGLGSVVVHANYLINLASSDPVMRTRAIQAFHDEMMRAAALGADYLVVHPGSARGKSVAQAITDIAQAIRQAARSVPLTKGAFDDLRHGGLRLLIENTSGMGSAVGSRFEELQTLLAAVPELPVGVCLDTAHAFHAGYAMHTEEGLSQAIAALDGTVGLERVAVLHVNDSKTPFGSRVDRHEHIGRGKIGLAGFRRIVNHPRLSARFEQGRPGRAFILETPINAPGDDRRNVRRLWELAGFKVKLAPQAQNGFSMLRATRNASPTNRRLKEKAAGRPRLAPRRAPARPGKPSRKRRRKSRG